jgi:hypothetical protein
MVNIVGTSCYITKLFCTLIEQFKFKMLLKEIKEGVFVLLKAVFVHPVKWT